MATCRSSSAQDDYSHSIDLIEEGWSEIPCRVSSDPHERCNDLAAVSRRDPAKLRYP
jgi:hypothetical protein